MINPVQELPVESNTAHLSNSCMRKLQSLMTVEKFRADDKLFWEGDPNDKLYFLFEGTVKLTKLSADGKDLTLYYFFPGDLFGEFDPRQKQSSVLTAVANDDCVVGIMEQTDLEQILLQDGDLAIEFTQWQSHMQHYTQLKLRDLLFHGKNGALAAMLVRTANTYGIKEADRIVISRRFTDSELANLIGSSRETVNRMLATFRREGYIRHEQGLIEILNLPGLRGICHCEECSLGICRL